MYIYPDNLLEKPMLWLWELKDLALIGIFYLLSASAVAFFARFLPTVLTTVYMFLSMKVQGLSMLDYIMLISKYLIFEQQLYFWQGQNNEVKQKKKLPFKVGENN